MKISVSFQVPVDITDSTTINSWQMQGWDRANPKTGVLEHYTPPAEDRIEVDGEHGYKVLRKITGKRSDGKQVCYTRYEYIDIPDEAYAEIQARRTSRTQVQEQVQNTTTK